MKLRYFLVPVLTLFGLATGFVATQPVHASGGSTLLSESFDSLPGGSSGWIFGGNSSTVAAGYPRVESRNNENRLRLTRAISNDGGYAIYDVAQTTAAGLDITMDVEMWGGGSSGADGMSLFLIDGDTTNVTIGALGGGLGYTGLAGTGGSGALLGVGLDRWGGFRTATPTGGSAPNDCVTSFGFNLWADAITVRGPGSTGYNVMTSSDPCSIIWGDTRATYGGTWTVRNDRVRRVRMVVDPASVANPQVKIYVDDPDGIDPAFGGTPGVGPTATPRLTFAQPAELRSAQTFKFGIAASTGGSTNNHDVLSLQVASVQPIPPVTWVTTSAPAGVIGTAYSQPLQARNGVATYSYSLRSGSLPAGVALVGDELVGTPTTCGDYSFVLRVIDSQSTATFEDKSFTVRVNNAQQSCVYVVSTTTVVTTTTVAPVVAAEENSTTVSQRDSLPRTGSELRLYLFSAVAVLSGGVLLRRTRRLS